MFEYEAVEEQLAKLVSRFSARDYSFPRRSQIVSSAQGWSEEVWHSLARLGLLAVNVPERCEGAGLGPFATRAMMTCFGRCLLVEPYLSSAVVATSALNLVPRGAVGDSWLSRLGSGNAIAVLTHYETGSRFDLDVIETIATRAGNGYRLRGRKIVGNGAGAANAWLVTARLDDDIALFVIERELYGLRLHECRAYDGHRVGELVLDDALFPASALLHRDALALVEHAIDLGIAALCAETAGVLDETNRRTLEYLKTRKQFGQPIGAFQALQHLMVDMVIHQELTDSMSWLAARDVLSPDRAIRRRSLSAAKVVAARAARFVSQQAIQLHGGIGMTEDLEVSHYARRLTAIEREFGDVDHHVEEFSRMLDFASVL